MVLGQQGLLHLSAAQVGLPEVLAELEKAVVVPLAGKGVFDCMDSVAADCMDFVAVDCMDSVDCKDSVDCMQAAGRTVVDTVPRTVVHTAVAVVGRKVLGAGKATLVMACKVVSQEAQWLVSFLFPLCLPLLPFLSPFLLLFL